jgi:hypothetical protein
MGTGACAVLVALLVAACSDGTGERESVAVANEAQADGGGWDVLAAYGNEVEGFDTLAQMGKIADVVVIAQATGVEGVRRVGPEGEEGIDLVQVRFEVIRAISDWDEDSILLELDAPAPDVLEALEEQISGFPPALLAVREKGREEAGFYRVVNSRSLWTEQPDGGLVAPLDLDAAGGELAVAEIRSLEHLGDHLEAARRDCDPECGRSQAAGNR